MIAEETMKTSARTGAAAGAGPSAGAAGEILRQASGALSGLPVTLWEAVGPEQLERVAATAAADASDPRTLLETLRRWSVPIAAGSRWVGCDVPERGWVVAPVRQRAADPPSARERRSP